MILKLVCRLNFIVRRVQQTTSWMANLHPFIKVVDILSSHNVSHTTCWEEVIPGSWNVSRKFISIFFIQYWSWLPNFPDLVSPNGIVIIIYARILKIVYWLIIIIYRSSSLVIYFARFVIFAWYVVHDKPMILKFGIEVHFHNISNMSLVKVSCWSTVQCLSCTGNRLR